MKRIGVFASIFIAFIIFIPNVKAIEELNIIINESNVIELYNNKHEEVTNDPAYTSAFTYSNDVLKLNEGYYFNYVYVYNNVHVTSLNKKVYLNMLYGEGNMTINKLYSESYDTEDTFEWDFEWISQTEKRQLYTHFHAMGSFLIVNSNIKLTKTNNGEPVQNIIHASNQNDLAISDSTIETDGIIYNNNGNIRIADSNVKAYVISLFNVVSNYQDEPYIEIENSHIIFKDYNLPDTVLTSEDGIVLQNSINANYLYIIYSTLENAKSIVANKASFTNLEAHIEGLISNSELELNNSKLQIDKGLSARDLILNDSNITTKPNEFVFINGTNIKLDSSKIDIIGLVFSDYINLNNSFLQVKSEEARIGERTLNYYSPLIVKNIKLNNSDFKAISNTEVPALILTGEIDTDKDNFVLVDANNNILELKEADLLEYGFIVNPNNSSIQTNAVILSSSNPAITQAYTGLYDNKASMYVSSSELMTYTLKIKNGKWADGTIEDKTVTLAKGDIPTKELFKSYGIPGYDVLTIKKTGDTEYTFIYSVLENPKTGVKSLIILFFISIIGLFLIIKKDKKTSFFKNI